uniref:Uncharacterized protein n=1 Tax=Peronospora matthiolae TaxID=2874970 RepID=A0AAV1U4D9_9STRA
MHRRNHLRDSSDSNMMKSSDVGNGVEAMDTFMC